MIKPLLFLLLILCLIVSPAQAQANSDFIYSVYDGQTTITGYTGSTSVLILPDTLGGYPVTAIRYCAFRNCTSLTRVVIPEGVTAIGSRAFQNCPSLTQILIPDSVQRLETHAFHGCCALKEITLPDNLIRIHTLAFYGCSAVRYCNPDSQTAQTLSTAGLSFFDVNTLAQPAP